MDELQGKVAIVTGAGRGIGEAASMELAKQGAAVLLVARSDEETGEVAKGIRSSGGQAETMICDVSRFLDMETVVERCLSSFGRIDILLNNAGIIEPIARITDSDPEEWGKVADINYKGVYHGLRAVLPVMVRQGNGVIINMSSGAASSALEGWSHYCSSKAAVFALTRCADLEYRDKGISVIGLSPGTVATDMMDGIRKSGINPVSQLDPAVHISPEWVGRAIAWLCGSGGKPYCGTDFSLKTEAGRKLVGLME